MVDVDTCSMPAQDASPKTRKSPQVLAGFVPGALRRRVCFPSEKDRLRMAMVASCTSCGSQAVDCSPVLLIAVSEAHHPVLGRGIEAHHVVLNMGCLPS